MLEEAFATVLVVDDDDRATADATGLPCTNLLAGARRERLEAPDLHFAGRKAADVAFAEAANLVFDPQGGAFHARAIELIRAGPDAPAGLHPGAGQTCLRSISCWSNVIPRSST